jgi:hypothetical protein
LNSLKKTLIQENSIEMSEKEIDQNLKLSLIDNSNHEDEYDDEEPLGLKTLFLSFVYVILI